MISNCAHPERGRKPLLGSQTLGTAYLPQVSLGVEWSSSQYQVLLPPWVVVVVCVHTRGRGGRLMSVSSSITLNLIFFQSLTNLELADELDSLASELSGSARVFSSSGITDEHRHAWLSRGLWRSLHKVPAA